MGPVDEAPFTSSFSRWFASQPSQSYAGMHGRRSREGGVQTLRKVQKRELLWPAVSRCPLAARA